MLYYLERTAEGTIQSDAGAAISDGIAVLESQGVCLETLWPYEESRFTEQPPQADFVEAAKNVILQKAKIADPSPDQIKAALAAGYPVIIGFTCFPGLQSQQTAQTGIVPMPGAMQRPIGGHCVCLNGFWNDSAGLLGFDNSWTTGWGQSGCGALPYDYFRAGYVSDCWMITGVKGDLPEPTPPAPTPVPPSPTPTPSPTPAPSIWNRIHVPASGRHGWDQSRLAVASEAEALLIGFFDE